MVTLGFFFFSVSCCFSAFATSVFEASISLFDTSFLFTSASLSLTASVMSSSLGPFSFTGFSLERPSSIFGLACLARVLAFAAALITPRNVWKACLPQAFIPLGLLQ
jgi:hypothetical protein